MGKVKIKIMSRRKVEDFCLNPMQERTALISITDYDNAFANLKYKPEYLLQLAFDDVPVGDGFIEEEGRKLTDIEISELELRYHSITAEQIEQIVNFYTEVKEKSDLLIVQCEHGQSRSAAIAAAIMEHETKTGINIFANDWFYPNKSLFRTVLKSLNKAEKQMV